MADATTESKAFFKSSDPIEEDLHQSQGYFFMEGKSRDFAELAEQ